MANTKLPLNLTRYAGKKFEQLHDAGCMCLTASSVPDLFGLGRNGRLSLAAHVMGIMSIDVKETGVIKRGKMMQDVVASWYRDETGIRTKPVHAWAKHPEMDLYASPDVITFRPRKKPCPGEIKIVAEDIFDEQWADGPPVKVKLQHQTQLALCNAETGPVIANRLGSYVFDLKPWDVDEHLETQEIILAEAKVFLEQIKAGELPPPDLTSEQDQAAIIALATVTEGYQVDLPDELKYHVRRYQKAGTIAKACEKCRKEAKAYLLSAMDGAQLGVFKDGQTVKMARIEYKEQIRKPYAVTRMTVGQQKKPKAPASPVGLIGGEHALDAAMAEG